MKWRGGAARWRHRAREGEAPGARMEQGRQYRHCRACEGVAPGARTGLAAAAAVAVGAGRRAPARHGSLP